MPVRNFPGLEKEYLNALEHHNYLDLLITVDCIFAEPDHILYLYVIESLLLDFY